MECLLLSHLLFKLYSHSFIYFKTPPMSVTKQDFLVSSMASITPTLCAVSHQSFSSRSPYGLIESIVQHLFKWQTVWCSFTTGNGVNINATATKPVQNKKVGECGTRAVKELGKNNGQFLRFYSKHSSILDIKANYNYIHRFKIKS